MKMKTYEIWSGRRKNENEVFLAIEPAAYNSNHGPLIADFFPPDTGHIVECGSIEIGGDANLIPPFFNFT